MTLLRLRSAPFILIEDDSHKNTIPLLLELTQAETMIQMFCYDQPLALWRKIFKEKLNFNCYNENPDDFIKYLDKKTTVIIDSVNQMAILLGWNQCLIYLNSFRVNPNIVQIIVILHRDCLPAPKMQTHLNHIANAIVSFHTQDSINISVQIKKSGKIARSREMLYFDKDLCLKSTSLVNNKESQVNEAVHPKPSELSTFKIEVAQIQQMEKYKLKLPYMSKINHGDSKVYYEPDAVDDWDDEDPDDDLDI